MPSDVKAKEAKLCPIEPPFVLPSWLLLIKINPIELYVIFFDHF